MARTHDIGEPASLGVKVSGCGYYVSVHMTGHSHSEATGAMHMYSYTPYASRWDAFVERDSIVFMSYLRLALLFLTLFRSDAAWEINIRANASPWAASLKSVFFPLTEAGETATKRVQLLVPSTAS